MNDFWHLHHFNWLGELSPAESEALRARSASRTYDAGEMVFSPTPHPQSVYLLESGLVRIFRTGDSGAETTFGYVHAGEIFGELAALTDRPRESYAQAARKSTVWRITRGAMREVLAAHPGVVLEVTKQIGSRMKRIESRVEHLVFRDVRSRVCRILLELTEDFGQPAPQGTLIDLAMSQEELATLVGATRQSVNAVLRDLQAEGLIERRRRGTLLLHPDALRHDLDESSTAPGTDRKSRA